MVNINEGFNLSFWKNPQIIHSNAVIHKHHLNRLHVLTTVFKLHQKYLMTIFTKSSNNVVNNLDNIISSNFKNGSWIKSYNEIPVNCSFFNSFKICIELVLIVQLILNWFLFVCLHVIETTKFVIADSFWVANVYKRKNTNKNSQLMLNNVNVQLLHDDLIFQLIPWNLL